MSETILQRVAKGEESSIEDCLDQYGGLVWSLARRYCKTQSDAEDAAQEIFVEIWKSAQKYDPDVSSESTFISLIARRRLIDRLRKDSRKLDTVAIDEEINPPTEVFQDTLELDDEVARTKLFLDKLKPVEKKVIELSVCQHVPQTQIAEILDLPLGTVKTHARRGMLRLREMLGMNPTMGEVS